MLKKTLAPIVSALTVLGGGFILFNLAFLIVALMVPDNWKLQGLLVTAGYALAAIVLFVLLKWALDKQAFKHTLWATLLTLPLMTVLVLIGIALYGQSDLVIFAVGAVVLIPVYVILIRKKLPWVYWLAVVYITVLGLIIGMFDIQI